MTTAQRKYTDEEAGRLADAMYEQDVLPKVLNDHFGEYLVLNFETGQYELGADDNQVGKKALVYSSPESLNDVSRWLPCCR